MTTPTLVLFVLSILSIPLTVFVAAMLLFHGESK